MTKIQTLSVFAALTLSASALAATRTYQVTGPIVSLTDTTITIMKGKEKWEIARNADTKVTGGELKEGAKVTIQYTMTATDVEVKGEGAKKESKKAK